MRLYRSVLQYGFLFTVPPILVYYGSRSYKENELEEELRAKYATNVTIATKNNQALSQFIRRSIETKGEPDSVEKDA